MIKVGNNGLDLHGRVELRDCPRGQFAHLALVIDIDLVDENIRAMLKLLGSTERWLFAHQNSQLSFDHSPSD